MKRGIAFDWFLFIFGSLPLLVASVFCLITKGRIPAVIGYSLIALLVTSILHGIEMRIDKAFQRIEELEKESRKRN